ncbi:Rgp1-domain-containing protein [Paxillus ammoniavirescens]|nr:Rgp1-domain-containing protein [Paxillus ammoniavirescens]
MSTNDLPTDMDSAIRVHVTPSQASYFAGEQFSVTITFTNTRTPESPKARNTHKRGAHSISSAPLARPPTSPGIPRPTALPSIALPLSNGRDIPARKRLIGQDCAGKNGKDMSSVLEQKRQSLLERSRSLSVDIPASELLEKNGNISKESASQYVSAYEFSEAGLPTTLSSPLSRTPDFQLPPKHPHARKRSTFDGQIQLNEVQQSPPPSGLTSSSTSTFSLALDPIAETPGTPYPGTPLPRSPSLTDSLDKHSLKPEPPHSYPPNPFQSRRPAQLGLGHGPPPVHPLSDVPAPSRSAIFPNSNSELILYSYAQLLGTFSITPLPGVVMMPEHAQTLSALRLKLSKRPIVGGGSMDITSRQLVQERRRSHGRSASLTSGLFSLLSPSTYSAPSTPSPSSQPRAPGRSRTPSLSSTSSATLVNTPTPTPTATNGVGLGLINGGTEVDVDPETPLPTFEVQPAMLAVDLSLAPGESRTYTYTLLLPENLPPTFRGRSLKISYELVIGTCRASSSAMRSSSSLGPTGANSTSRVMKVPIRVYNNVTIGKIQRPYDLLWPVAKRRVHSIEAWPKVADGPLKSNGTANVLLSSNNSSRSLDDLRDYGQRLLGTFPNPDATGVRIKMPSEAVSPKQGDFEREREGESGALTGCREAVEILTRNPKKVSYDVNKEGVKVAVLTFTKSAYRLGETVLGVVELNDRQSRSRVMSLSAMLEAQEMLPSQISSAGGIRHMRRVHAEHHSTFVSSCLRTTFSLDIPSDASPAFQIQLGDAVQKSSVSAGGLVWRVRLCLLVAVAAESSQVSGGGVRLKHLVLDGPPGEWGTSYKASPTIAPKERPKPEDQSKQPSTWTQFLMTSFLGTGEREYHDGDEEVDEGVEREGEGDREDEWKEVKVETVECEVPISVWPGNTAFKAMDVVFDV